MTKEQRKSQGLSQELKEKSAITLTINAEIKRRKESKNKYSSQENVDAAYVNIFGTGTGTKKD